MKKLIVALASFIATVVTVSGQTVKTVSEQEVWNVIMKSKQANALHGISNPNQILPGQVLSFRFSDGFDTTYIVEPGDFQCRIVRRMLETMPSVHGLVVNYDDTLGQTTPERKKEVVIVKPVVRSEHDGTFFGVPWYGWLIILVVLVILSYVMWNEKIAFDRRQRELAERRNNPATAGPAMYSSGITEDNAHNIMMQNAHRQYPMHNVRIERIERGTLDSHGVRKEVGYLDHPRQMVLNNIPGIRATVFVDDATEPSYVFSILQCGNDIRMGAGIANDGITFTPTPNVQPMYTAPVQEQAQQPTTSENVVVDVNQSMKEAIAQLPAMVDKVVAGKVGLNVTLDITSEGTSKLYVQVLKPGTSREA